MQLKRQMDSQRHAVIILAFNQKVRNDLALVALATGAYLNFELILFERPRFH
jgi:hypothetical protein